MAYGAVTALSFSTLATLANAGFAPATGVLTANDARDCQVEMLCTVGTVSGNKQYLTYVVSTLDGTNYSDSTLEANLRLLGATSATTNATAFRSLVYSVAGAFNGEMPPGFIIVVKNDSGVSFTAGSGAYRMVY